MAVFLGLGLLSYHLYVAKVGAGFMHGRFFGVTLPLWLVLAQLGLGRRVWPLALLGATVSGQPIVGPEVHRWNITAEARAFATSGIGMVGFYSRLRGIDVLGRADPKTARRRVGKRGMPGHEKTARLEHLRKQGVLLLRYQHAPERWLPATPRSALAR